jgi:hypothetical protein
MVQYVNGSSDSLKVEGGHSTNCAKRNRKAAFTSYSRALFVVAARGLAQHNAVANAIALAARKTYVRPKYSKRRLAFARFVGDDDSRAWILPRLIKIFAAVS